MVGLYPAGPECSWGLGCLSPWGHCKEPYHGDGGLGVQEPCNAHKDGASWRVLSSGAGHTAQPGVPTGELLMCPLLAPKHHPQQVTFEIVY